MQLIENINLYNTLPLFLKVVFISGNSKKFVYRHVGVL